MKKIWHKTEEKEFPAIIFREYEYQVNPKIPCLVKSSKFASGYGVVYWDCVEKCWEDREHDDEIYEPEFIDDWAYLDDIINLK